MQNPAINRTSLAGSFDTDQVCSRLESKVPQNGTVVNAKDYQIGYTYQGHHQKDIGLPRKGHQKGQGYSYRDRKAFC